MPKTPDILIWVLKERLSDGSFTYQVQLPVENVPAVTEDDASEMAAKIVDAINEHSNFTADTAA